MTTIIKNQIVKQLARFTKNLSPSKISLKFLKGEGELRNLELNETFLTELLELPPFIRLTRAVCNKISAKIYWTRLKTDPIRLYLDCVEVEMVMTENITEHELQQSALKQPHQANQTSREKPSEYGFVEKVVDGMLVTINSVVMAFKTPTFRATFQMSHLSIHSTSPEWEQTNSLRSTRIKDEAGKEVLTFKQITFGTLRVDADALYKNSEDAESTSSSPLRLITSSAKLNIVIKKRTEDCAVVSARLHAILDDVLWVLTHAQLQAVAGFAKSVVQVVEKAKKCEPAPSVASDDSLQYSNPGTDYVDRRSPTSGQQEHRPTTLFQQEDVKETWYRVTTGKIDVHLCDDAPIEGSFMDGNGQSGGSMQIVVNKLAFEHYPYHLAFTSRIHWSSHNDTSLTRAQWVQELFGSYKKTVGEDAKKTKRRESSQKPAVNASNSKQFPRHTDETRGGEKVAFETAGNSKKRSRVYLYECAFVISCDEFTIMPVATNEKMKPVSTPFLCSDKQSFHLPSDMPALQFDYTLYFYPGQEDAKVPQPNLFCQLNPLHLTMDNVTCIWFHRFMQSIRLGFIWAEELITAQEATPRHIDVRIDGLMPKLTLPCPSDPDSYYNQYRPQALQVQMSSFRVSNTRIGSEFKQSDLVNTLEMFIQSKLYTQSRTFPNDARDVEPLPQVAWLNDFSVCSSVETIERFLNGIDEDFSKNRTSVVWMLNARQCWCDFVGIAECNGRPRCFVEPFPLRLCMCYPITTSAQRPSNIPCNDQSSTQVHYHSNASQSSADRQYHAESHRLSTPSSGHFPRPSEMPLHRSPSDPYCKQHRPYSKSSSTKSTPLSSPGFAKVHKSRSATSVNIPVLPSDMRNARSLVTQRSGSSSLSHSASEGSSDSFFEDTGSGSAQSIHAKSNFVAESLIKRPSSTSPQVYQTTGIVNSTSGVESMSDGSPERVPGQVEYSSAVSSNKDQQTAVNCALSGLLYVPNTLAVKLDHFQFVFLMRLQESFLALRDVISADSEKFDKQRRKLRENDSVFSQGTGSEPQGIVLSLVSKGAEVVLLVPAPNDEQPDVALEKETRTNDGGTESPCFDKGSEVIDSRNENGATHEMQKGSQKSFRVTEESEESVVVNVSDWMVVGEQHPDRIPEDVGVLHVSGHKRSASDTIAMKRLYHERPASETASLGRGHYDRKVSDASSANMSTYGSEVSLQTSERSCSDRDTSVVTVLGKSLECSVAINQDDLALKMIVSGCKLRESYQQSLEALLAQKVKNPSKEISHDPGKGGEIRLRYALGSTIDHTIDGAVEKGVAHLLLSNVKVAILSSILDGILECVQDEVELPPPLMPAVIDIKDLRLTINSDTPLRLLSLPPSSPLNIHIEEGTVRRNANGDLTVKIPSTHSVHENEQTRTVRDGLVMDSEKLIQSLRAESNEMASRIASIRKENLRLVKELDVTKEDRESLEHDRDRLLMTVERLTEELVRSNREHDEMQKYVRQYRKS